MLINLQTNHKDSDWKLFLLVWTARNGFVFPKRLAYSFFSL
jgi:hypothetical protein